MDRPWTRLIAAARRRWLPAASRAFTYEAILRAELFSAEQMADHGIVLARQHQLSPTRPNDALLSRLTDNAATLAHSCAVLARAHPSTRRATPAAEWLLDNYYLVEEHIRIARSHLPKGYSRELPRLANGPCAGLPRVYDIALEAIAHGDGRVDEASLSRFVQAYQSVTPLALGELWGVAIMLRLALIENLRRVAARVMANWTDRNLADDWADRLTDTAEHSPREVVLVVADMVRSAPPMTPAFVAELTRRLQGQSALLVQALTWVEQMLAESGLTIERLVHLDAQQQAADQVSISNSVASLRMLAATDWREFVERMSHVEHTLCQDPTGVYAAMDFASRDHYRHVIERLARHCAYNEEPVAAAALALATEHRPLASAPSHVGFYLIGAGLPQLEQRLGVRVPMTERWQRLVRRAPLAFFLTPVAVLSVALAWPLLAMLNGVALALLALPAVLLTSRLAMNLINGLVTFTLAPCQLPRLDFSSGIPAAARTLVVVPTLIADAADVQALVEDLEVRYLANRDEHLHFALLTDFLDAPAAEQPADDALLAQATQLIQALNRTYPTPAGDRFCLLHRPRCWNPGEQTWMGLERKRGKLAALNALLLEGDRSGFAQIVGDVEAMGPVRYVITLDTDTQLPRDTARQFVGALEHPLNHARLNDQGQVVAGYAILQPRIGISLPSAARSAYARLFGSDAGIDPYTRAVSDVYQDLFDNGSFIGKGIYDVAAFEGALQGRFPANRILSHDLIEGCYAHSGLLSDVQLFEQYPSGYLTDVKRRHRWIRGDWQLLPWLLPWARAADGRWCATGLTALARWKLFDNLRRSLEPAALLALLLWGWLGSAPPLAWTLTVLALILIQPTLDSLLGMLHKAPEASWRQHLSAATRSAALHFARSGLALAWLPFEAGFSLDAIARTLWRLAVSKRHLLQWSPSREVERQATQDLPGLYRTFWLTPVLAGALGALLLNRPLSLAVAAPVLMLWLAGPALAWWVSLPSTLAGFDPSTEERRLLHRLARRTWAFFDQYIGPEDHWLVPDNIQEAPYAQVAHRTSPTNLGMALLAHLAAHDFGYLGRGRLLTRLDLMLTSMEGLERHRGHLYNWYDTQTLAPLKPLYVSTVDSGNLAGLLLTLRPGLLALADAPPHPAQVVSGLLDTLDVLLAACRAAEAQAQVIEDLYRDVQAWQPAPDDHLQPLLELLQRGIDLPCPAGDDDVAYWRRALHAQCLDMHQDLVGEGVDVAQQLKTLAARVAALAVMDFTFLYDAPRDLFAIGYNVTDQRLDSAYYDLLASEVRLTHFIAIAQGQVPQASWFSLGRLLTSNGGVPVLLSWSGSMFEYLMPLLVMPTFPGTLLDQTCRAAVARQVEYGNQLGLPWGVSESAYNAQDAGFTYQYRAFGVPGLGLKRGLGEDSVVAPYASVLALLVAPQAASRNLQRLGEHGLNGRLGLYEAVDYTQARLPPGQRLAVVRSFMAHHQGMSLLALTSVLLDRPMQRRFASDPQFQACELLLQERVPRNATRYRPPDQAGADEDAARQGESLLRVFSDPAHQRPAVQLLSNGRYHVMVNSAGAGYSRCDGLALTRWQEDGVSDQLGFFCYLRDVASGTFWSTSQQPSQHVPYSQEAIFSDARAEFRLRERDFDCHTEIVVSPEDDVELRRLHLTNRGRTRRTLELTSYAEVVLAPALQDALHPAFSKLFVQTELLPALQAIVCTRRPGSQQQAMPWMCHLLAAHGVDIDAISYETDRARFIGRGRTLMAPAALDPGVEQLSGSQGSVLDPIVAVRCRITLDAGQSATIDLVTGLADTRDACVQLIHKYRDRHLADRVFDLAWTHSQVLLRQLNASSADAHLFEHLAASVIYANASLRADNAVLISNRRNQSGLWGQAISGDLPIVLVQIGEAANLDLVRQMVQAHAHWRQKGLAVDLVIWNESQAGYRQLLQDLIMGLVTSGSEASLVDRPGGIFIRPGQQLSAEDRTLLLSVARVVVRDTLGTLEEQVHRRRSQPPLPRFDASLVQTPAPAPAPPPDPTLMMANTYGGFSADGSEYIIHHTPGRPTPAPWVNVLANPHFGTLVSESGSAYTWAENAHEYRLTPWHNDPVSDPSGEALYLRDEDSGRVWSPTPQPCPGPGRYRTRHGFGYSVFEHDHDGLHSELWVYVALDAPVKFLRLTVRNTSGHTRRLSATQYVEWVLGDLRSKSAMHVVTEADPFSGALFARNAWSMEFSGRVAFLDTDSPGRRITGNRAEFLGRNGSLAAPAGLSRSHLSGRTGGGLDPCSVMQVSLELADGASQEVIFRLGAEQDATAATRRVQEYRGARAAGLALEQVRAHWRATLGVLRVHTPEPEIDVLVNGWLMYQVIASRFWGRSGFYQSGGAIGFRDQLQDSMAMLHSAPEQVRAHLLLCARHQFREGDVQHWWHPPLDRGVRTRCSDDLLWLPLATSRYVQVTGDLTVLDERVDYAQGRVLNEGEESYYDLPTYTGPSESLYQHCQRALDHGLQCGSHGLPLMGSGDWNDGMNRVGERGLGESVWLGFFGYDVLQQFALTAQLHGDSAFALRCDERAADLRAQLQAHAWDGDWYRRAWFDDGQPLGSASNDECRIDSIAQSWAVLSRAAPPARARTAMAALDRYLVRRDIGIVQLLTPPFDSGQLDPGYIKGYVPGVRENGGQYTHAAVWASMAFAVLGDGDKAWELLRLINPVRQGNPALIERYKVEPYVMAADVYAAAPHAGRGGWTWYTGSAGWMYRLIVESLLGVQREGNLLRLQPLLPKDWPGYSLDYRFGHTQYRITVSRGSGPPCCLTLSDDGGEHSLAVFIDPMAVHGEPVAK